MLALKTEKIPAANQLVRDRFIWIYYGVVGLQCSIMAMLGPIMPFLKSELAMSYQLAGFHFSAFALGSVVAGLSCDTIFYRLGQQKTIYMSGVGTIVGLMALIMGQHPAVTILGILIAGFTTSVTYQTLATVVSNHLKELRTFAFVEAESMAMFGALIGPFAVSLAVATKLGWRAALIILALAFIGVLPMLKTFGKTRTVESKHKEEAGRLPLSYWSYALVIFLSVAAEWSTAFWSADYLHERLSITKALAAATVGAFFAGMFLGRLAGVRMVRMYSASNLLILSGVASIVGFLMFWLGQHLFVNVIGLFITGIGIANMYPLSFSAAVSCAENQASKAIARITLMGGSALLLAPLLLSSIADRVGLFGAYGSAAFVLVLCLCSIFWANSNAAKHKHSSSLYFEGDA